MLMGGSRVKRSQLTRWRRPSSDHWRRSLRTCAAGFAASALLMLAACSGDPEFPETVGPTSTPDETEPAVYEPTLPPYTSEVELSAEDEAEVEELLLLIDEFTKLTSTLEEPTTEYAESLEGRVEAEMLKGYIDQMEEAIDAGKRTDGAIVAKFAKIIEFANSRAVISTCYDFSKHIISEVDEPGVNLYPGREKVYAYDVVAMKVDDNWILVDQFDSEVHCSE